MKKRRADERLFEELNLESLSLARALIMEGRVFAGERKLKSPGELVSEKETMRVRGALDPYVSRGAHKLKKALEVFALDVKGGDVRGRGRFPPAALPTCFCARARSMSTLWTWAITCSTTACAPTTA